MNALRGGTEKMMLSLPTLELYGICYEEGCQPPGLVYAHTHKTLHIFQLYYNIVKQAYLTLHLRLLQPPGLGKRSLILWAPACHQAAPKHHAMMSLLHDVIMPATSHSNTVGFFGQNSMVWDLCYHRLISKPRMLPHDITDMMMPLLHNISTVQHITMLHPYSRNIPLPPPPA